MVALVRWRVKLDKERCNVLIIGESITKECEDYLFSQAINLITLANLFTGTAIQDQRVERLIDTQKTISVWFTVTFHTLKDSNRFISVIKEIL